MRKENTFNQGLDENLICRSLEFFASHKIGMTGFKGLIGRSLDLACQLGAMTSLNGMTGGKCIRKRGMTNKKGCQLGGMTLLFCLLTSTTVHAECVPAPDCASIGYTETSCETASLKCPFDTSKLFCIPCDSSYKYTCSGTNITGGVGSACGGKYVSCSCLGGATFNNGSCPQNCTVGMIYYSDKSCSSTYNSSKTAIGVVVKDNELVMSERSSSTMYWSNEYVDTSLDNLTEEQAKNDFNGKINTATIIAEDSGNIAAKYCNNYTTTGTSAGDWYLPAAGELYSYVGSNYSAIKTTMTSIGWSWGTSELWSSSESDGDGAWDIVPYGGDLYNTGNTHSYFKVSCFLDIS